MRIVFFNLQFFFKRVLLFFVLVFAITSCKNTAQKDASYTIGFSQCVGSDLWRKTMLDEMRMELSLHPNTNFIYEDANNNSDKQIKQVKKMLNEGIDLLIISPNEARPLTPIVEEAYHKGIPVIVIDRKTASDAYTAYVGADNYQIGKMAGQYVGSTSRGPVNLLEVMGLPGSSPAIERERGFQDGIKKFGNIHIIHKVYGDWLKQNAEAQLQKVKDQLQNINAVFAHNDVMGAGVHDFFNRYEPANHVKIIGVDALPGTGGGLQMVADKVLSASMLYPTGGKEAIVTAFHILNHEPFSRENILQSSVIDSSNVQLMKMQWNRISSQQKDIEKQQSLLTEQQAVYNSQQVVLNIIVITLVLAIIFGGVAFYSLVENRKITRSLEAKNAEILDQRNQLVEMSAKAEAATEAKFNFFTNISHEFRTPLTLMLSPLEDITKQDRVMAVAGRNIQLIRQNAYRLLGLVNQLLDYRKIEYDKKTIKASENDLVSFVRGITECFRLHAEKLHIQLNLIPDVKTAQMWFDPNMLDKVFFNLIANAIKFSGEKGKVKIRIKKEEDGLIKIEVEDNGAGMTEEETTKIFDQFYQADHAPLMGSGIGLSLSKQIVELHGGRIEVRSEKWRGTTFTVSLPLGNAHLLEREKHIDSPDDLKLVERSEVYRTDLERIPSNIFADAFSQPKEYTVLLIEDNLDLLQYMQEKFAEHFEVYTATTGMAGLNEAYERVPDLIITDVVLPQISGKSLCEKLKSDVRTSHIPIILLTAQNSTEQQISGIQAMADLYVTKPFNSDLLIASVQNLIRNRLILKEHFTSDITPAEKLPVSKTLDKKFINDFAGIVEQNLGNDEFNVDDICKLIGISRVQLYRKVKALLGCSITEYILNRRLKKAKYLLTHESYTIAEITYMTGFSNPNYFSTVFKSHYGCSPTEYKKKNQAIEP
jgi:signal transduction histidine kinase/AraC-like DNA-binding protein/CheY-like chemotaxis protein/ABC-type xylose transport system substrate-binding protein